MNLAQVCRLAAAGVLAAATVGSLSITRYLSRLEAGVLHNVRAAQALVDTQTAIRDRNAVLSDMVVVTDRIGAGLDGLISRSEQIGTGVRAVSRANSETLQLNRAVEANNDDAARELARVVEALIAMNQSASAIAQYMSDVADTAARDMEALRAIGSNTARMNARTPGW